MSSPEEIVNAMLDAGDPQNWLFSEHGKRVVGKLVGTSKGNTSYGPVPIIVLEVSNEPRSVWLMHTALRNEVKRLFEDGQLAFGDWLGIEYKGKQKTKDGSGEYDAYDVRLLPVGENRGLGVFGPSVPAAELESSVQDAEVVEEPAAASSTWGNGGGSWSS